MISHIGKPQFERPERMATEDDGGEEAEAEPAQPAGRRPVSLIDEISQHRIDAQQLISPTDRTAQERNVVTLDRIGPEQPGSADAGKDVEVGHTEHDLRSAVDKSRPRLGRLPVRVRQRRAGRPA